MVAKKISKTSDSRTACKQVSWEQRQSFPLLGVFTHHPPSQVRARVKAKHGEAAASVPVHIVSANNFPTAAGLASSAAGYAALVYALANFFDVADTELSSIAR